MKSGIYKGRLRHRRFQPVEHIFSYHLFMMYIDFDELPHLFDGRWLWSAKRPAVAWFRRGDYLGSPIIPLDDAVRNLVEERSGVRPSGPIRLLTHLRYFGHCFNPVSFYYCFDSSGRNVETIVAEITNTPWDERHSYVLTEAMNRQGRDKKRYVFDKHFHVSPFMDMNLRYDWRFLVPGRSLAVHMENRDGNSTLFDATLTLDRQEINGYSLAKVLAAHPLMTGKVVTAIYWQALRLWMKNCPYFVHPSRNKRNLPREVIPS